MRVESQMKGAIVMAAVSLVVLSAGCRKRVAVPPPMNQPPSVTCAAASSSVRLGSGPVAVTANATDPNKDTLTYAWSATGGSVQGTGASVQWNPSGLGSGGYRVSVKVTDPKGESASCDTEIRIQPNAAPSVSCNAERSSVLSGERVRISASGSDAEGDTLRYTWRTSGGQVVGSGSSIQLDTSGLSAGTYTVTGRAEDGRGGATDCNVRVEVRIPPPPPQADKLNEIMFRTGSSRIDNVGKRILDDVATRLNADPNATAVLIGYADTGEARGERLAAQRADAARKYLADKGISAGRISRRTGSGRAGAGKQNQKVEVIWVPAGASF